MPYTTGRCRFFVYLFFFFCACSVFVFDFFLILLSLSNVCLHLFCRRLFPSYGMSRIFLCCKWEDNIKLKIVVSRRMNSEVVRGLQFSCKPRFVSTVQFHGKFWVNLGYRIYPKYPHPLLFTLYSSRSPFYV